MVESTVAPPDGASPVDDDAWFAGWRARELSRVDREGMAYLDYTGAALYPESLVRDDFRRLERSLLGNPHSENAPSRAATSDVESARRAVLHFLHADPEEYVAILTANASAACRLVAESFPFTAESTLALSVDNHNSVNGIREYAGARGASLVSIALDHELRLAAPLRVLDERPRGPSLFAFPAQSNFTGVQHPLALIAAARERGWRVLLDAAGFVPTAELRLDHHHPDFVALSVYKIAGYPTGVGALVARRESLAELRRPSFAGGTVHWVSVQHGRHRLFSGPEGFEDGTVPFLALGAVAPALAGVGAVGRDRLARHLRCLTSELLEDLQSLHHADGTPLVTVHGPRSAHDRGATVAISLRDAGGTAIPYWDVEDQARSAGLAVRGGCFCNPGCAEAAFGFPSTETARCLEELGGDFTIPRFAACLGGRTVGAIRLSLGLGSVRADVTRAIEFVGRFLA